MNGIIFDIQRFSVHDGPGVRTTVFFKGCPLRCGWCHNPEGLEKRTQLQYRQERCIGCKACALCPRGVHTFSGGRHSVDFARCTGCGECGVVCPAKAVRLVGQNVSPGEILTEALRDRAFYGERGGVTFSGGECTMQPAFLLKVLSLCREAHLPTAVDTCGFMPPDVLDRVAERCDLMLYDIKAVSPDVHRAGTGVDNALILRNYQRLMARGCRVWVRIPVIGGFNASEEEMARIADFLRRNPGAEQIELMPYHRLGAGKYAPLGYAVPEDEGRSVTMGQMRMYHDLFTCRGLTVQGVKEADAR